MVRARETVRFSGMSMCNNKIIKNASWIVGCKIAQSALSFVVTMLTARFLGPSNYGLVSYAASLVAFVTPIAQLGLGSIQVQELVNDEENEGRIIGTTLLLNILSATLCVVGIISFSIIVNSTEFETILVCALYSIILFFQGAELLQYWFQTRYISKYYAVISLIAFAIVTVYRVVLLISGCSIYYFAVANAIDYIIITIALLFVYHRLGGQKLKFSFLVAKKLLRKSKHYIVSEMMVAIFSQTDRIMLKMMLNESATGIYSAAMACGSMANFVYSAIISSFRPTIFSEYKVSEQRFNSRIQQLYSLVIYLSLTVCLFVTFFAKPIIYVVYGAEYIEAVLPLQVCVWYSVFSYLGVVRNIWVLAKGKQKYLWIINFSGAIGNIALNYILIPIYGVLGAAIASLVTQVLSNVIVSAIIPEIRPSIGLMLRGINPMCCLSIIKKSESKK